MKCALTLLFAFCGLLNLVAQNTILGHSHNDYAQQYPLKTAFDARMGSIEADVYLVNNNLFVAHDAKDIHPSKSLDKLYLKPLAKNVRKKKAYPLILLIDIKSQSDSTLTAIIEHISSYSSFLEAHCPIQFVISGNRPHPEKWSSYPTFIQFDGRPDENYTPKQWTRVGMVSESFGKYVRFGQKNMSQEVFERMKMVVDRIHTQNKKVRFWATPDTPDIWQTLMNLKVDFINTDSPAALRLFLNAKS